MSEHSTAVEKCGELIDDALAQLFSPTGRMLCAINQIALPQVLLVPLGNLTAWIMAKQKRNLVTEGQCTPRHRRHRFDDLTKPLFTPAGSALRPLGAQSLSARTV